MIPALPPRPDRARQLLPKACYRSEAWFEREHEELFGRSWGFACVAQDIPEAGDYRAVKVNRHAIVVLRAKDGGLRAYHNTCRHRGTQFFEEGGGNCRHGIVCPYHAWTYEPEDGSLRGLPKRAQAFPDMKLRDWPLHRAAVGQLGDLIFINPQAKPEEDFETWLGSMRETHMWPHSLAALSEKRPVRYDIRANWKVFCENAMDGYHLSYLHDKTLKGPDIEDQDWDAVGRHWVFIAHAENEGRKNSPHARIPGLEAGGRHPVVWQLFPNSGVLATSIFFSAYRIVPVAPERCYLDVRTWMAPREGGEAEVEAAEAIRERPSGTSGHGPVMKDGRRYISLETVSGHPMQSLDFQIEDMWVCEQQQKALASPAMKVGPLADRGETSLTFFQANILAHVPLRETP